MAVCPIKGCGAGEVAVIDGGVPMLCQGYGHWDWRCMANWLSADPEDLEPYEEYLENPPSSG